MLKIIVLDVENSVQNVETIDEDTGRKTTVIDNSPYNPLNKLVCVHWRKIEDGIIGTDNNSYFFHNNYPIADSPQDLQKDLDWADIVVGHNIKYDYEWLKESGFKLPEKVYCTMIGEYILARGTDILLSLEQSAIRRNVAHKKADLIAEHWDAGTGFEAMPIELVREYCDADVLSAAELYLVQLELFTDSELNNIVTLMNEMLLFLVEIEGNGIKIDLNKLVEVEIEFQTELEQIKTDLNNIVKNVMGDTPINLNSGVDMTKVVYSRVVTNRDKHIKLFNIGPDLWPPYMTPKEFTDAVRSTTKVIKRTVASHCETCDGHKVIRKFKVNGDPFKNMTRCPKCDGKGYLLTDTDQVAGLKLSPEIPADASANGFSVSKLEMDRLLAQAYSKNNLEAVEFLTKKKRLNAINTYLNSFVEGIRRWTRADGLLHPGFNQTRAKTGRLSSSNPNFQNQPKGQKFPVRQCVVSRFEGGSILECDFSGLEFRVAGDLSRDPQIIGDVLAGKDIHRQTASIVYQRDGSTITKDERDGVKPDTFAPLYGAQGNNKPPHIKKYYQEFFNIYKRHGEWQEEQMEAIIRDGFIRTPSGREYTFPGTKRTRWGVTNSTQIKNYPIQGFATGDIVVLSCVRALRKFRELKPKSLLILTVHDSIVSDVYPGEEKLVYDILKWATEGVVDEIKERWNYEMALPLASEQSIGPTWGHLKVIHYEA